MSVDKTSSGSSKYLTVFNTSGNWTAPTSTNQVFVAMRGGTGGNIGNTYFGGSVRNGGAYVVVTPGTTYAITIGAAGTNGATSNIAFSGYNTPNARYGSTNPVTNYNAPTNANAGGTTTFDSNSVTAPGSGAATQNADGSTSGNLTSDTTVPGIVYPPNTSGKASSIITSNTLTSPTVTGIVYIYSVPD